MTLPNVPTVTIQLDRPRRLALTLAAMLRMKQVLAERKKLLAALANGDGPSDDAALLLGPQIWAMLIDEDRDLSVEAIEACVHMGNLTAIMDAVAEVSVASTPEGTEGKAGPAAA